jgi:hypothetical protein
MTFREFSEYLRRLPVEVRYNSRTGNIESLHYNLEERKTVIKRFIYVGDSVTSITLSGNIPSDVTETKMELFYDNNNELIKTKFS